MYLKADGSFTSHLQYAETVPSFQEATHLCNDLALSVVDFVYKQALPDDASLFALCTTQLLSFRGNL